MITKYQFGELTYAGKTYNRDLIILKRGNEERILSNWWRKEGHLLQVEDLVEVFAFKPDYLIIGTGASGIMRVEEKVKDKAKELNIILESYPTPQAVERFNQLLAKGVSLAGAFHLTC
ncbi:MAG: MTH938/NDUFAF3 family protein [Caldimicrobium sp.]|nr:MTH938/NDUFAF3 family protein [Caldimicrobium sp.]MCX7872960.1 MTH938/NDUFAF3 family protein [Caldimicrobium sp.]MDW8094578.1 MTH938/NDUFAF3 family protein [Caldimicrobium sp.]